jgi:putative PIN family toxin of toxin-antitoxin system
MNDPKPRIVLDTNIWISALLFSGIPARLIQLADKGQVQVYISQDLMGELADVLNYPKFQARLQRLGTTPEALLINVARLATFCESPLPLEVPVLRDPKDIIVLQAAVSAGAIAIVSGDDDLLVLKKFADIQILTVGEFLTRYFPAN